MVGVDGFRAVSALLCRKELVLPEVSNFVDVGQDERIGWPRVQVFQCGEKLFLDSDYGVAFGMLGHFAVPLRADQGLDVGLFQQLWCQMVDTTVGRAQLLRY